MPSYAKELTNHERWELAYYSMSLADYSAPERSKTAVLEAPEVASVPASADDSVWRSATEFRIPLTGQATFRPRWQTPSVTDLSVRAVWQGTQLALLLAWEDPRADTLEGDSLQAAIDGWRADTGYSVVFADSGRRRARYPDAVEVMMPQAGGGRMLPNFVYGDAANPVRLWRWRAELNRVTALTARGADRPPQPDSAARDSTVTAQWRDGRWTVLIHATLPGGSPESSAAREFVPVAFHVWDGNNGETGLRMALSSWYFLRLRQPASSAKLLFVFVVVSSTAALEWALARWTRRRAERGELAEYGVAGRSETLITAPRARG
jgi:hypothetical protein